MNEDSIGLFWVETISLPESAALPCFIVVVCDLVKSPTELCQTLTSITMFSQAHLASCNATTKRLIISAREKG